jgi:flagellum-specific ATP synthase
MEMIARNSDADINVIGLIGERGREVAEFIEKDLSPEGLKRSVIVAVTSDQSPLMRVRGAKVATAIAEHFSSEGKSVMLMLDSLTRVAMSQREIGNAIGEPPTTKGYTPSVFSLLPKLLERAGGQRPGHGPISALYTVLIDGDDFNDPIADAARSILDGHINLTRELATRNHFPAIDITTSCSRVMNDIVDRDHWAMANQLRSYLGTYQQNIDLIQIGAYQAGSNPRLDEAISLMPLIERFLCQDMNLRCTANDALKLLDHVLKGRPVKT